MQLHGQQINNSLFFNSCGAGKQYNIYDMMYVYGWENRYCHIFYMKRIICSMIRRYRWLNTSILYLWFDLFIKYFVRFRKNEKSENKYSRKKEVLSYTTYSYESYVSLIFLHFTSLFDNLSHITSNTLSPLS